MKFVNFNIAELLFKLGFCEKCFGYYYQEPNTAVNNHKEDLVEYNCPYRGVNYKDMLQNDLVLNTIKDNIYPNIKIYNAPTIAQALKWLREKKKIYIEIFLYNGKYSYFIKDITQICKDDLFHKCLNDDTIEEEYEIYKDAVTSAIEYVLDNNLI